jgi:hypothetical protein
MSLKRLPDSFLTSRASMFARSKRVPSQYQPDYQRVVMSAAAGALIVVAKMVPAAGAANSTMITKAIRIIILRSLVMRLGRAESA